MEKTIQDLLQLAKSIHKKHSANFSFLSLSALSSNETFFISDSSVSFETIDEKGFCEIGLEPIQRLLKSDYLSEKEILEILDNAKIKKSSAVISSKAVTNAVAHQLTGIKYVAQIQSKITNRLLCSKLGSKPYLGHIYENSVIHCGKAVAVIPFVESSYFLAKTLSQELKNYNKQYFLSPKVLLMENHGHLIFGDSVQSVIDSINTLEEWSELLSSIFAFSSPKYLSHEQIINIENSVRDKRSFLKIRGQ